MITVVACGYCADNGQPTQRGGSATTLTVVDDNSRKAVRTLTAATGNSTQPQSDIKAVLLGLSAIKPQFKIDKLRLSVTKYVERLLVKNGDVYKTKPQKNPELVVKLRTLVETFRSIEIITDVDGQKAVLQLARKVAETQESSDSGTVADATDI